MKIPYDADLFDEDNDFNEEVKTFEKIRQKKQQSKMKMMYHQDNKKRNKPKRGGKDVWASN